MSTALAQRAAHLVSQVSPDTPADAVLRREVYSPDDLIHRLGKPDASDGLSEDLPPPPP
jgi:hypothetical protein